MTLGKRFAAARAADAMEFEQALVRLYIVASTVAYFAVYFLWDGFIDGGELVALISAAVEVLVTLLMLAWVVLLPGVNHLRRRAGVVVDVAASTYFMLLIGESGALLFAVYVWVAIGNGFRYGRWMLHFAQVLAIAGFTLSLIHISEPTRPY